MGREPAEMERVRNMFEWGAGRGGGVTGRQLHLRVRAPWWSTSMITVSFSRKRWERSGHDQPRARPPPLPSFDIYFEPGVQARFKHLPILRTRLGKAPRFLGSGPQTTLRAQVLRGWAVRMYSIILFWKLNASSFLILYKEETNKVCFCVYCLFIVH